MSEADSDVKELVVECFVDYAAVSCDRLGFCPPQNMVDGAGILPPDTRSVLVLIDGFCTRAAFALSDKMIAYLRRELELLASKP